MRKTLADLLFSVVASIALLGTVSGCSTLRPANQHRRGLVQTWGGDSSKRDARSSKGSGATAGGTGAKASWFPVQKRDLAFDSGGMKRSVQVRTWRWPLDEVQVTSHYGRRSGEPHEGLDLRASSGTPVKAIADGRVLYADRRIKGYGRMVIVRHPGGWSSVYAHGSLLRVKPGQKVKKGQLLAYSGASGRVTGPHLHFELRYGTRPVDPEKYLPSLSRGKPLGSLESALDVEVGSSSASITQRQKSRS